MVHVGDAHCGRMALLIGALAIGAVDRLAHRVGGGFRIPARHRLVALDHVGGLVAADVAVDVDREPLAARMRRAREMPRDRRASLGAMGWATGEQHYPCPWARRFISTLSSRAALPPRIARRSASSRPGAPSTNP